MITMNKEEKYQSDHSTFGLRAVLCPIVAATLMLLVAPAVYAAPLTDITIDGSFSDWASVPSYYDADAATDFFHFGTTIPDVHDTDHDSFGGLPVTVTHPDVDILEFKLTHDANNLYAYFRASGEIGRTMQKPPGFKSGRYYVIVTIDVDNDVNTGYWLHEGGYYPTSDGYDMNMEVEFYNGEVNTAHYLSHDALSPVALEQDFLNLTQGNSSGALGTYPVGYVQPASGNYDEYTQWVYHDNSPAADTLTLVVDKGPVVPGIMTVNLSPDGHELEFAAPFKGFLDNSLGNPNMGLGKVLNVSFSLEASGELATGEWASDTTDPIVGYTLDSILGDLNFDLSVDSSDFGIMVGNWNLPSPTAAEGNFNEDEYIDAADIGILFENWTSDTGPDLARLVGDDGSIEALTVLYDADLNNDSLVGGIDFGILNSNWAETTATAEEGNINEDGYVDGADVGILYEQWTGDGTQPGAVPEPSSMVLATLALCGVLISRTRKFRL